MEQAPTASEAMGGGSVPPEAGPSLPKQHQQQSDSSNKNKLKSVDLLRLTLVSGNGTQVHLEDRSKDPVQRPPAGNRGYLDCVSGDVILGHSHPAVTAVYASTHQDGGGRLTHNVARHVNNVHPETVGLTRRLMETLPEPLSVCFFVNSHSEANDLALNLAFSATGSEEVICFDKADHGRTLACLRLGNPGRSLAFEKGTGNGRFGFGNRGGVTVVPTPDRFRGKYREPDFHAEDIGWMYTSDVKEACRTLTRANKRVGPLIFECMSHDSGNIELPVSFVKEAIRTVKSFGGVVIADETHCGLGRTGGTGLWAFQKYCGQDRNLVPDIVTVGKSLGNGHPLAAVVTSKEIAKKFNTFISYFNYLGDPLSCAIGCAVIDQLKDGKLLANVTEVGDHLKKRLIEETADFPGIVGQVRGMGLSLGLDIIYPNSVDPNPTLCHLIRNRMIKRQVCTSVCGSHRNVLGITPAFNITQLEADEIVRLLVDCLKEVTAEQAEAGVAAAVNRQVYSSSDAENTLPSGETSRKRTATDEGLQDLPVVQVPSPISSNPPKRFKYDL